MPLPKGGYTDFVGLAKYARCSAEHSARRNGHQEWAYWREVESWADRMGKSDPAIVFAALKTDFYQNIAPFAARIPEIAAWRYAQLVHLRKMIVNAGKRAERLSLAWLKSQIMDR